MTAEIIQADYQKLEEIATRFDQQSQNQMEQFNRVQRDVSALKDGGWIGAGSKAFFAEMDNDVYPAQRRLTDALEQARSVTLEIKRIIEVAEKEAAQSFLRDDVGEKSADAGDVTQRDNDLLPTHGPPFGDYHNLANIDPLILGPGATHQDLAAAIEQLYRLNNVRDGTLYGVDEPIKIVKIGQNDYLVLIAGTDADDVSTGANDWFAAFTTGAGVPSRYQIQVMQLIEQNIPSGANIHLAGHSQGGHVAQNLAGTQALVDQYNIASVTSYGSSGSASVNPRVGESNYHSFLLADDPIQLHESLKGRIPFTQPLFPNNAETINPQEILGLGGHTGYHHSDYLAGQALPFSIDTWEVVGSYEAGTYDNTRVAWDNIQSGLASRNIEQVIWGSGDFVTHTFGVTALAAAQSTSATLTQYLPTEWSTTIDRQFDQLGERVATASSPSQWMPNLIDDVWSGFWN